MAFTAFVTRALPGAGLARLASFAQVRLFSEDRPPTREELVEGLAGADGVLTMLTDRIDEPLLALAPRLRVVSNMAVGVDNLDLAALTGRGIPAGHTPGVLTEATADVAFALLLAVARRVVEARDALLAGEWTTWRPSGFLGLELSGATLGIVGLGRIGEAVARRARGFGMHVLACSRTHREAEGVSFVDLDELLCSSDVVSLHVALSEETHHLIGAAELSRMRRGALLVNTARGPVVDQRALFEALASGHLGGAGLDVFEVEPVPLDEPLLGLPNCVAIPHLGSATEKSRAAMADLAVDNLLAGLRGEPLPHCANPEVYGPG
ncbi:MAG TPA: D-glycerate dehydrogenase [Acidimicrobiales bacterium]|nr:D-glycerate dehydrogenase [Acidimicrobiales bacterium]